MLSRLLMLALLSAALPLLAIAGSVKGTIHFEGEPPEMRPIDMKADPACAAMHAGAEPLVNEALVLGEGQTMANILVRVVKGLPEASHPAPSEPVVLTQAGCHFSPRVVAVMPGQTLKILNPDGIMHNVNAVPKVNRPFNRAMPKSVPELDVTFDKPEDAFMLRCDIHPWMRAFCVVVEHPFFDITEKDGVYTIEGLAPGEYEIEAWHERLAAQTATIKVEADGTVEQDFVFKLPEK